MNLPKLSHLFRLFAIACVAIVALALSHGDSFAQDKEYPAENDPVKKGDPKKDEPKDTPKKEDPTKGDTDDKGKDQEPAKEEEEDDDKEKDANAGKKKPGPIVRAEPGTMLKLWPESIFGLTDQECQSLIAEMILELDLKSVEKFKRHYYRRIEVRDFFSKVPKSKRKQRAAERAISYMSYRTIVLKFPKKPADDIDFTKITKIVRGTATYSRKESITLYEETSEEDAKDIWIELDRSNYLGVNKVERIKVARRKYYKKDGARVPYWSIDFRGLRAAARTKNAGADVLWELISTIPADTDVRRIARTRLAYETFKDTPYQWWEEGHFYEAEREDKLFVSWAVAGTVDDHFPPHLLTALFCHLYQVSIPEQDVKVVRNRVLSKKMAASLKLRIKKKNYIGVLDLKSLDIYSNRRLRSQFKRHYAKQLAGG